MSYLTDEQARAFAGFLTSQAGPPGRAALAELRRAAANPTHDMRSWRILGHLLHDNPRVADTQVLLASLFALYAPGHWQPNNTLRLPRFAEGEHRRSLGASLRRLRQQLSAGQDSLDLRVTALLNAPREDLAVPLRGLLQRLTTAERPVPVDFAALLRDLVRWDDDAPTRPSVRRRWASDYWQPAMPDAAEAAAPSEVAAAE